DASSRPSSSARARAVTRGVWVELQTVSLSSTASYEPTQPRHSIELAQPRCSQKVSLKTCGAPGKAASTPPYEVAKAAIRLSGPLLWTGGALSASAARQSDTASSNSNWIFTMLAASSATYGSAATTMAIA